MYNAVGGSTIHWGLYFPRFHPLDFCVKIQDGVVDDWPMIYAELEFYYDLNDRRYGVLGLRGDFVYFFKLERLCFLYFIGIGGEILVKGFNKFGWYWWLVDNVVLFVWYDGCEPDIGIYLRSFSSSDVIYWLKVLQQGARLKINVRVREILVDENGWVKGVFYYDVKGDLQVQLVKVVVLASNGVGIFRLLLNFKLVLFLDGFVNISGMVGKNLMYYFVGVVVGVFNEYFGVDGGFRGSIMFSQEFYETDIVWGFFRGYDM